MTAGDLRAEAEDLRGQIARYRLLREGQSQTRGFVTRAESLHGPAEELAPLLVNLRLFRRHSVSFPSTLPAARTLADLLATIAEEFQADRSSILAPSQERKAIFWDPLRLYPGRLAAVLREAWSARVGEALPAIPDDLLAVLGAVPGMENGVARIRELQWQAQALTSTLPRTDAELERPAKLAADIAAEWNQLSGGDVPESVLMFLREATAGGAAFADYVPEVRDWMRARSLENTLVIRVARRFGAGD